MLHPKKVESRYTVGLAPNLANQVARYAKTVDTMSKAIAALVRIGLESQEDRQRDFFKKIERESCQRRSESAGSAGR
jgi:hypothetical protein